MPKIKLEIELIPKTCHYKNARQKLKTSQWDTVRKYTYQAADYACEICGLTGKEQGFKNNLEAHEVWAYNKKTLTQKLVGLIALCPLCHQTKHFGRSSKMGKQAQIFTQLETINGWNHKQVVQHVAQCFLECKERSQYRWSLDLSILTKAPYNLIITPKKRKKYKRKS